jgi:hypothetical protein
MQQVPRLAGWLKLFLFKLHEFRAYIRQIFRRNECRSHQEQPRPSPIPESNLEAPPWLLRQVDTAMKDEKYSTWMLNAQMKR